MAKNSWCTPAEYKAFKRLLIAEAGGEPKCYLCGRGIDTRLPGRHGEAFTIDHIQPRQFFPKLAKEPRNLASAHRRCNSSKGMKTALQAQNDIKRKGRGSRPEWD